MTSANSKTLQSKADPDSTILRELSNLSPAQCLSKIAIELQSWLNCETACILLWHEVYFNHNEVRTRVLVTEYDHGLPESLKSNPNHSEIYDYGEGITGGYVFAERNTIRATINLQNEEIIDDVVGKIELSDTKWGTMRRYAEASLRKDFKSLLGLPLIVKNKRIGVVKLINKFQEGSQELARKGFTKQDLKKVEKFISTIELVVESKTNEEQTENFLAINEKVVSADFNYHELLQEIARNCADSLNLRVCIIRLFEHKKLKIMGNSVPLAESSEFERFEIPQIAISDMSTIKLVDHRFENVDQPRKKYKPKLPNAISSEFDIQSLIVVPIIYQDKAIGTIECYASIENDFPIQIVTAIKAYGTLVATLFQRNRTKEALASVVQPFSLLPTPKDIYERARILIQDYLDTTTVSVWQKRALEKGFQFEFADADKQFRKKHELRNLEAISDLSLTAKVADGGILEHFSAARLKEVELEQRKFLEENAISSLTIVPISFAGQSHAVIDVCYDEDRILLKEEADFLRLLAAKAASALWNQKLATAFKAISEDLLAVADVGTILKRIADFARDVLFADLVILFEYDSNNKEFVTLKWHGEVDEKGMYSGRGEKQNDFANLMLGEKDPLYFRDIDEYKEFCQNKGTVRPWYKEDFWHREQVKSMAAVRLDDSRGTPVGVMFFNYRRPFLFDETSKRVIESFASQAALAIVNARFRGTRNQEVLLLRTMLLKLGKDLTRSVDLTNLSLDDLQGKLGSKFQGELATGMDQILEQLQDLKNLTEQVGYFRNFFLAESESETSQINSLLDKVLAVIGNRLSTSGIKPRRIYGRNIPERYWTADVEGMLFELISILLDARKDKSSLTVETRYHKRSDKITICLKLAGGRVNDLDLERILEAPVLSSYKDGIPLPGRYAFCGVLADDRRGTLEKELYTDGLTFKISFA